jgi:hypothetical protein
MNDGNDGQLVRERAAGALNRRLATPAQPSNLADLLERVLDKGIVIAGDITLSLATVDILTLKIRLLVASVDKAQEIGINWWQSDPALSSQARALTDERDELKARLEALEQRLGVQDEEQHQLPRQTGRIPEGADQDTPDSQDD